VIVAMAHIVLSHFISRLRYKGTAVWESCAGGGVDRRDWNGDVVLAWHSREWLESGWPAQFRRLAQRKETLVTTLLNHSFIL
jgi:hypothetical protein